MSHLFHERRLLRFEASGLPGTRLGRRRPKRPLGCTGTSYRPGSPAPRLCRAEGNWRRRRRSRPWSESASATAVRLAADAIVVAVEVRAVAGIAAVDGGCPRGSSCITIAKGPAAREHLQRAALTHVRTRAVAVIIARSSIVVTALRVQAARMRQRWNGWHGRRRRHKQRNYARQPHGPHPPVDRAVAIKAKAPRVSMWAVGRSGPDPPALG